MAKPGYCLVAEHVGWMNAEVLEMEYQSMTGRFNKGIYTIGDFYWAGGKTKPKDHDGLLMNWEKVISCHDGKSVLWRHSAGRG